MLQLDSPAVPASVTLAAPSLPRRPRRVARRRVRVELGAGLPRSATDGAMTVHVAPLAGRHVAWRADRVVALVVLHTGCGMRLVGQGGVAGELRLPAAPRQDSYLAFCYDEEVDAASA